MISLYNFGPFQGLTDPSPFCLKVDCYMRAAGIEFETKSGANYIGKSPKHKLPYIEDDGVAIGDSSFIIEHFKEKYGDTLDKDLNAEQKAVARAFMKMLDENLYWCIVHSRWIGEGWPTIKKEFFGKMPFPLKMIIPGIAQKGVKKSLYQHGLGRHSEQEILDIARKDIKALADFLGTKDYFLINKPTSLDVSAFAFLAEMIVPELKCELNEIALSFDNLVKFVNRMKNQFYAE
ncbi:MAG: glutathione S-transferase [Planctomycetota bacterium]|jgi:glutathione S-transferase